MTQHLADVDQRSALAKQLARQRVAQPVRADRAHPCFARKHAAPRHRQVRLGSDASGRAASRTPAGSRDRRAGTDSRPVPRRHRWAAAVGRCGAPCLGLTTSPHRQSRSPNSSRDTSTERRPSRASRVRIAKLRVPSSCERSQLSSSRMTSSCEIACGMPVSRQPAADGTASASASCVNPRRCRNRRSERSSATRPFAEPDRDASALALEEGGHLRAGEALRVEFTFCSDAPGEKP